MNWPKQIVLVRHGESEGNVKLSEDTSFANKANHQFALTERGRKQVEITGKYVRSKYGDFDAYFCSTFHRTQETLSLIFPDVKPIIDPRLNELWRGIWHTMSKEEIAKYYPMEKEIKEREGWYHHRAPGGQNGQDVESLIYSFLSDLRELYAGKRVFIASHGVWQIFLWRVLCNRSIVEAETRYTNAKYKNASVTVFESEGDQLKLVMDDFLPVANRPEFSKDWFEMYSTTPEEVEKTAEELRTFMTTNRWRQLLDNLKQTRQQIKVYEWQDACDDHDAMYLSGNGFVFYNDHPVEDLIKVVENFMTHDFYGAREPGGNKAMQRHPSELLPWLNHQCTFYGVSKL